MTTTHYLVRVPGRRGFYFQRRCPSDVRTKIGKVIWRWKLSDDLIEARRLVLRDLLHTDALIAQARGDVEALNKIIDQSPRTDQGLAKALRDQPWVSAVDVYPTLSAEAAEELVERHLKVEAGEAVNRSLQELFRGMSEA